MDENWGKYQEMVLQELRDLKKLGEDQAEELIRLRIEVAKLNVKSGVWGAFGGLLAGVVLVGATLLKGF